MSLARFVPAVVFGVSFCIAVQPGRSELMRQQDGDDPKQASGCSSDKTKNIYTCVLSEYLGGTNFTETPARQQVAAQDRINGVGFRTGWLVLLEASGNNNDTANWSDLVLLSSTFEAQLFSDADPSPEGGAFLFGSIPKRAERGRDLRGRREWVRAPRL